jgi:hypothetical protein
MKKILPTIGVIALVVSTTSCTWNQIAFWNTKIAEVAATPDPADDIALKQIIDSIPPEPDTSCREWYWYAIEAGFTHQQWIYPLSGIMWRESNCDPNAHNPSGATGLTQVMPMWIDDCGGGNLRDPVFNLACAHHIWEVSGWGAWSTYPP